MEQLWLFPEARRFRRAGMAVAGRDFPLGRGKKISRISMLTSTAMLAAIALQPGNINHAAQDNSLAEPRQMGRGIESTLLPEAPEITAYDFLKHKGDRYLRGIGASVQDYLIIVDKDAQKLGVYRLSMELVDTARVSTGAATGTKEKEGDMRTPNGVYQVVSQEDSSKWLHNGKIGAYGKYFSRLNAGAWDNAGNFYVSRRSSIGVHGTNHPGQIGARASEGCIRLLNTKNEEYVAKGMLKKGTVVAVVGDYNGKE